MARVRRAARVAELPRTSGETTSRPIARDDIPAGLRDRIERENRWDRRLYDRALARQAG